MFTSKKMLNCIAVTMLFGLPTASFSMDKEEVDISCYGKVGWTGYNPSQTFQHKEWTSKEDISKKSKNIYSYELEKKRGLASFESPYKEEIKDPQISYRKDAVILSFASKDSSKPLSKKTSKEKLDSPKGVEVKKDRAEIKLDAEDSVVAKSKRSTYSRRVSNKDIGSLKSKKRSCGFKTGSENRRPKKIKIGGD